MAPNSDLGLQWGGESLRERFLEKVTFKLRSGYRAGATKGMESSGARSALGEHVYQTWKTRRTNTCWQVHESSETGDRRGKQGQIMESVCAHARPAPATELQAGCPSAGLFPPQTSAEPMPHLSQTVTQMSPTLSATPKTAAASVCCFSLEASSLH